MATTGPFLFAVDSDGCAFDSMEIKHKECFIPQFIRHFGLQPVSSIARTCGEFANLYSQTRGVNRFPAYVRALGLLAEHPEAARRGFVPPQVPGLRDWIARETRLGTKTIVPEAERTGDPDLAMAARWSAAVDAMIAEFVHNVPPFPGVRDALRWMTSQGTVVVCSATPKAALEKEWREHGLTEFVAAIHGQEDGSKSQILARYRSEGWAPAHMLMVGDSPGDFAAAQSAECPFFPIVPGREEASWSRFVEQSGQLLGLTSGNDSNHRAEVQECLMGEFEAALPENPPWAAAK